MNSAIHLTLTPITEVIDHAVTIAPSAEAARVIGWCEAHLRHRDEAIADLHETIAELTRRLETLQARTSQPPISTTFVRRDSATPASVQEFAKTAWGDMPMNAGESMAVLNNGRALAGGGA